MITLKTFCKVRCHVLRRRLRGLAVDGRVQAVIFMVLVAISLVALAEENSAHPFDALTPTQYQNLQASCAQEPQVALGIPGQRRHFSLSPKLPMSDCLVIDSLQTFGHSFAEQRRLYRASFLYAQDRKQLLLSTLIELDYLSDLYRRGNPGYPESMDSATRNAYTKDKVGKVLTLVHFLLKNEDFLQQGSALALASAEVERVLATLGRMAEGLTNHLFTYDMFATCFEQRQAQRLLFMVPVLWVDLLFRINRYAPLGSEQLDRLATQLNLMLQAHAQAAIGLPIYTKTYEARSGTAERITSADAAHHAYQYILRHIGMEDRHGSANGVASFKLWFQLREDPQFCLTNAQRLGYASAAFYYAELSRGRIAHMLSAGQIARQPASEKLLTMAPLNDFMVNSTLTSVQIERAVTMSGLYGEATIGATEAYAPDPPIEIRE